MHCKPGAAAAAAAALEPAPIRMYIHDLLLHAIGSMSTYVCLGVQWPCFLKIKVLCKTSTAQHPKTKEGMHCKPGAAATAAAEPVPIRTYIHDLLLHAIGSMSGHVCLGVRCPFFLKIKVSLHDLEQVAEIFHFPFSWVYVRM